MTVIPILATLAIAMGCDLLLIDHALDHSFLCPVEHWAQAAGFIPDAVHPPAGQPLPEPGRHRHIILSGSEDTITKPAPWAQQEVPWLREAIRLGARVLGSCWGHQFIAAALGGPACVRHAANPEFGWKWIEVLEPDGLLPSPGFFSFCSHFDEVILDSHPDMKILARTPDCQVHALRWGSWPVWGIQAHPEIDPETGRRLLQAGMERMPGRTSLFEAALAHPAQDSRFASDLVHRFLAT